MDLQKDSQMKTILLILLLTTFTFGQSELLLMDNGLTLPDANRLILRTSEGHIVKTAENKIITVINNLMVYNENFIFKFTFIYFG